MARTIGTHNLHDDAGVPTFFADAIGYTEAIAANIQARKRARWAKVKARLAGYTIRVCTHQKDLVMALKRRHWKVTGTRYEPVHDGIAGVTPHRGTFVVETIRRKGRLRRATGCREVFLLSHRINAAFPPYRRGEGEFRADRWMEHAITDDKLAADYRREGWVVHGLGDLNTPPKRDGYVLLPYEVGAHIGHGYDRIASTEKIHRVERLSAMGSDHPRLRAIMED